MKELKQPWENWHSMNSSIKDAVPDGSALASDPLFQNRAGAEDLELLVVRPNISRGLMAQEGRLAARAGTVHGVPGLLRSLFDNKTVNLTTSRQESAVNNDKFLPLSFFLNSSVLFDLIGLNPPDNFQNPRIAAGFYRQAIGQLEFRLEAGSFHQAGDTFFSFLVPEPSFEDGAATDSLIRSGLITPRFAATVLAVDFANPVFSTRRMRLARYVPESATLQSGQSDLSNRIAAAIRDASQSMPAASAEREFLALWDVPEETWRQELERRIAVYLSALTTRLASQEGVIDYMKLSESRRREFSRLPLREPFDFMLPMTNIPQDAPLLQMTADGTVVPK
jgi:hypothetical protein